MSEVEVVNHDRIMSVSEQFSAGSLSSNLYTFYDRSTVEGQLKLLDALSDTESLRDYVGETVKLNGFTVHEVEYSDEDGVVQTGRRTVLDTDKGLLSSMSTGVEKALMNALMVFGEPVDWPGALSVKVVELKSRRGYRFLSLKPVLS